MVNRECLPWVLPECANLHSLHSFPCIPLVGELLKQIHSSMVAFTRLSFTTRFPLLLLQMCRTLWKTLVMWLFPLGRVLSFSFSGGGRLDVYNGGKVVCGTWRFNRCCAHNITLRAQNKPSIETSHRVYMINWLKG